MSGIRHADVLGVRGAGSKRKSVRLDRFAGYAARKSSSACGHGTQWVRPWIMSSHCQGEGTLPIRADCYRHTTDATRPGAKERLVQHGPGHATTKGLRAIWQQRKNRNTRTIQTGVAESVEIGSQSSNLRGNAKNDMSEETMEWTPEAIAAAGGNMGPIPHAEARRYSQFPMAYGLHGDYPDPLHTDPARVMEICRNRTITMTRLQGLVIETTTPSDRWYITFSEPDADHAEQWFYEASGGEGELFGPDDFEAFLKRLDIGTRAVRLETRNGFRVLVFEAA